MHAYFLIGGDPKVPIIYEVDRIRDGRSFTTRRVVAIQHGHAIFSMSVSFHGAEGDLSHQFTMPDVPKPDELPTEAELRERVRPLMPEAVRRYYRPFDVALTAPFAPTSSAAVYRYEMPGGQYTNLYHQAQALGLEARWSEVCRMYAEVNRLFGDIIKVTPTSKVVGDMALFMVANDLPIGHSLAELVRPQAVSGSQPG